MHRLTDQARCDCGVCRAERWGNILAPLILFIILILALFAPPTVEAHDPHDSVTICHATGSTSNPYVKITISFAARDAAHINRDTGRYHGQNNGTFDYEIAENDECATPARPSTEPTAKPIPTPMPSDTLEEMPGPTDTPTSTAPAPTTNPSPSTAIPTAAPPMLPDTALAYYADAQTTWLTIGSLLAISGALILHHAWRRRQ